MYYADLVLLPVVVGAGLVAAFIYTNPFSKWGKVEGTFRAVFDGETVVVHDNNSALKVSNGVVWRLFAWAKLGFYIVANRYGGSARASSQNFRAITREINALRYDPHALLLISGDHYVASYPRGMGIFNYPTLDPAIPSTSENWAHKQVAYLQTLGFILGVFAKRPVLATTLVPTGRRRVTCVNSYSYPSDTLYAMLFALAALLGLESAQPYPYPKPHHTLHTQAAAQRMLQRYKPLLHDLLRQYTEVVYDPQAGLVRNDIHLSGTKDITRRKGTFYDNVICWKTNELAQKLGLAPSDERWLADYKERILRSFWLPAEGYFLEDLTAEAVSGKYYSSDWLVVLVTGFISPFNPTERQYFTRSVEYIRNQGIDQPFAIKYQQDRRARRLYLVTRLAVSSYGGDSIWSFWGMEYIKVLLALYKASGNEDYLQLADYHIGSYKRAMEENRGFPEVYDSGGKLLQTPLYRSVRQTSWVIGFEQVLAIRNALHLPTAKPAPSSDQSALPDTVADEV